MIKTSVLTSLHDFKRSKTYLPGWKTGWAVLSILMLMEAAAQDTVKDKETQLLRGDLADSTRLNILVDLAKDYIEVDLDKAKSYLDEAKPLAEKQKDKYALATIALNYGVYYDLKSDIKTSLGQYFEALRLYEGIADKKGMADVKINLSAIARQYGDQPSAVKFLNEALKIYTELQDSLSIGIIKLNLASSYGESDDIDYAMQLAQESLELARLTKDSIGIAYALQALATGNYNIGKKEKAISLLWQVLQIATTLQMNHFVTQAYKLAGSYHLDLGKYDSAKYYLNKALYFANLSGYADQKIETFRSLSSLYIDRRKYDSALLYANYAYALADTLKMPYQKQYCALRLNEIFKLKKNYKDAERFLQEAYLLKDTLISREKIRDMEQAKFQLELDQFQDDRTSLTSAISTQAEELYEQKQLLAVVSSFLILSLGLFALLWFSYQRVKRLLALVARQNRQLDEANNKLEEMHEEMKAYSYVLVHDLKTPLNAITALTTLLPKNANDEIIQMIRRSASSGLSLIDKIMELRQVEQVAFNPVELDAQEVLDEVKNEFVALAHQKEISLILTKDVPTIIADPFLLKRTLHNLISNAIKFSPKKKSVTVTISAEGDKAGIQVKDEGPGFSEYDRKNLFKRFKKLSARPTGTESSHGLGLASAKAMVDKMGGQLVLQPASGAGSHFTILLSEGSLSKRYVT